MAKGTIAKSFVSDKIVEIFGDKVVKVEGSKIYINAQENGEMVQVAVALTCPKVPVAAAGATPVASGAFDWSDESARPVETTATAEITAEEEDNIRKLMEKLGL